LSIVNKRQWLYLLSFYADVYQTKYFYALKISIHWLLTYCLTSILTYIIFTIIYFIPNKQPHTACAISKETQKKLNSSITARPNGLIFLPRIEAYSHSKSIRTRLVRSCVKYIISLYIKTKQCVIKVQILCFRMTDSDDRNTVFKNSCDALNFICAELHLKDTLIQIHPVFFSFCFR